MADGADSVMTMGCDERSSQGDGGQQYRSLRPCGLPMSGWQTGRFGGYRRVGKRRKTPWTSTVRPRISGKRHGGHDHRNDAEGSYGCDREKTEHSRNQRGVGGAADGSEMVIFDLMGFIPESAMAKHSKAYGSFLMDGIKACAGFAGEINSKAYPAEEKTAGAWMKENSKKS